VIVVLISGRGSNLQALLEERLPVSAVISNRPDARGLVLAVQHDVPTEVVPHKAFASREAFDTALAAAVGRFSPRLVVLAGFMRVLTPAFVDRFAGRLVNIHPSLLPAFTGLHTHERALAAGVKLHGCTVHFVTAELDHGPIIIQAAVPVKPGDTAAVLAARVLRHEHVIYPRAVRWFLDGKLSIESGLVRVAGNEPQLVYSAD